MKEKLEKLNKVWEQYCMTISQDHHKSRDFNYQIYWDGDENGGSWSIEHYGYINHYQVISFGGDLTGLIDEFISEVEKWIKDWRHSE